jgi:hypothetical protein
VRRTLRLVNIAEEALTAAVARTAVILAVAADSILAREAEEDSTVVAADTSAARVFVAGGQPPHGKWVADRTGTLVDGALARAAIPLTSEGARLARMARGVATPRPDEGWVAPM